MKMPSIANRTTRLMADGLVCLTLLSGSSAAWAQGPLPSRAPARQTAPAPTLRAAIERSRPTLTRQAPAVRTQPGRISTRGPRSTSRGALIAGGVLAGMYVGSTLGQVGPCSGDDGCLGGAIRGMFLGGAIGGVILGALTR